MESVNALKEDGYVVVRGAVSPELTEKAINVIKNEVKITMELEEFTQYDFSQTWLTVLASVVDVCPSSQMKAKANCNRHIDPCSLMLWLPHRSRINRNPSMWAFSKRRKQKPGRENLTRFT